jgi:NADH-quinone oxidoreductase subunit H
MALNIYDFSYTTHAIDQFLNEKLSPNGAVIAELVIIGILFLILYALLGLALIYLERKVCAIMQNRIGPNRVGKWGIIQTVADMIKLLMKELIPIRKADKFLFNLAPFLVIIGSIMAMAALPFAKGLHALDFNIGIFYVHWRDRNPSRGMVEQQQILAHRGHAQWCPDSQL